MFLTKCFFKAHEHSKHMCSLIIINLWFNYEHLKKSFLMLMNFWYFVGKEKCRFSLLAKWGCCNASHFDDTLRAWGIVYTA